MQAIEFLEQSFMSIPPTHRHRKQTAHPGVSLGRSDTPQIMVLSYPALSRPLRLSLILFLLIRKDGGGDRCARRPVLSPGSGSAIRPSDIAVPLAVSNAHDKAELNRRWLLDGLFWFPVPPARILEHTMFWSRGAGRGGKTLQSVYMPWARSSGIDRSPNPQHCSHSVAVRVQSPIEAIWVDCHSSSPCCLPHWYTGLY